MRNTSSVISPVNHKMGKKRSEGQLKSQSGGQNNELNDVNPGKKKIKKIRIRLTDPNIPDSYICEVFDSSLEKDEENDVMTEDLGSKGSENSKNESKPRNYFDLLMSREGRCNNRVNSALLNEKIPEETKLLREFESEEVIRKRRETKTETKKKLIELSRKKKATDGYCSSTSDEESLFQVQSDMRFYLSKIKKNGVTSASRNAKDKENAEVAVCFVDDDDSQKSDSVSKTKNANILNYFSRNVGDAKVESRIVKEFNMFENVQKVKNGVGKDGGGVESMVKLAPLFQKRVKNAIDPSLKKARRDFLQNGIPSNLRKVVDNRKIVEEKYSGFVFPVISHVQQKDDDDEVWNPGKVSFPWKEEVFEKIPAADTVFRWEIQKETANSTRFNSNAKFKIQTQNKKGPLGLSRLRQKYRDLDIEGLYNGLKKKRDEFRAKMEERASRWMKTGDGNDGIELLEEVDDRLNTLWTAIYKPRSSEIIGNKQTVAKLSGWLKSWKDYNNEMKKSKTRKWDWDGTSSDDSDDEFISSDDVRTPRNVCLLSGPIGSGKTALVYALASELGYNVLEVNASSKRTGKKLLLDLQEATKSHRVRTGGPTSDLGALAKSEIPKPNKKKKKKLATRTDLAKKYSTENEEKTNNISLILIEDADIFFEDHDEGFVSALLTLVQSSKRPFIFLSNDPNYHYFERLRTYQALRLEMKRPGWRNLSAVLDVISTLEGVAIDGKSLENLVQSNKCDLRKSILELQFWIQSGGNLTLRKGFALGRVWWGFNKFLYQRDSIHHLKLNYRKRKRSNELYDSTSDECENESKRAKTNGGEAKTSRMKTPEGRTAGSSMDAFVGILDVVAVADLLGEGDDNEPVPGEVCKPKDGLSLAERFESVDWPTDELSRSIAMELVNLSACVFERSRYPQDRGGFRLTLSDPSWEEKRWRNLHKDAKRDLMALIPSHGGFSRRAVHLDYLPLMRGMCRTERDRYSGNTKRKNRFQHYFQTLGHDLREDSLEISNDVFDIG